MEPTRGSLFEEAKISTPPPQVSLSVMHAEGFLWESRPAGWNSSGPASLEAYENPAGSPGRSSRCWATTAQAGARRVPSDGGPRGERLAPEASPPPCLHSAGFSRLAAELQRDSDDLECGS